MWCIYKNVQINVCLFLATCAIQLRNPQLLWGKLIIRITYVVPFAAVDSLNDECCLNTFSINFIIVFSPLKANSTADKTFRFYFLSFCYALHNHFLFFFLACGSLLWQFIIYCCCVRGNADYGNLIAICLAQKDKYTAHILLLWTTCTYWDGFHIASNLLSSSN